MNIIKKTALYFARKKFCRKAIEEHADLTAIREKPSKSIIVGMIMIAFSYMIGLPAVVALGVIAVRLKEPLVGIVGGPLIYTISTIIFIIGIKVAGKKYFLIIFRWAVRVVLVKILGEEARRLPGTVADNKGLQG